MDKSCLELPQISYCKIPRGINVAAQATTEGGDRETNREKERWGGGGMTSTEESRDAVYLSICKSTCRGTVRIMSLLIIRKNVRYVNEVRI